ncbi:hypothetical protein G3N94_19710 [Burkholderia sp. Ac-20353]|nr:hypothetical protein [Burkholderia sp. Ac-20353]
MRGTKVVDRNGSAASSSELGALGDLEDMLRRLAGGTSAEQAEEAEVARCVDGLKAVARRIATLGALDRTGRELAARYYCAGIAMGVYGHDSAIACGIFGSVEQHSRASGARVGRARRRIFASLVRAGRRHGQAFMASCGRLVRL